MDRQITPNTETHRPEARVEKRAILDAISSAILHHSSLRPLIQDILEMILPLGPFDMGRVRLLDPRTDQTTVVGSLGCRVLRETEETTREPLLRVVREVMKNGGHARVIDDASTFPNLRTAKREGIRTAIFLPICDAGQVLGCLALGSRALLKIGPERVQMLEAIANHVGIGVTKARLFEETSRNLERIRALHEINLAVTSTLDLKSILDTLLEKIEAALSFPIVATVRMFNRESRSIELLACRNITPEECQKAIRNGAQGLSQISLERMAPLVIPNALKDPRARHPDFFTDNGLVSYFGLPLIAKGEALGTIAIFTKEERDFSAEEIEFLSAVASHGAAAIHNSQLYHEVKAAKEKQEEANRRFKTRTIQQAVLNHFGQLALSSKNIPTLLDEAALEISLVLQVDYCEVLELRPDGERLVLRAGTGWKKSAMGQATVESGVGSHAGYALAQNEPVIVEDFSRETRFQGSMLLREHGVVSGIVMPIAGQQRPFGTIGAYMASRRDFTEEELHFVMSFAYVLATAFDRFQAEQKLRESQRRYEDLVESIEGIVWEADAQTFQATFVSHQAERILGFPVALWIGEPHFWLHRLHPQDRRWVTDYCKKATREMRPFELEYRMMAADGRVIWIRNIVTVVAENQRPAKLRGVCFDITEHRRMEREISEISERERQRIGQDLHDELGQFLTGIACISTSLAQELEGKSLREAATATQISDLTNQAIKQTRSLARGLYPVELQANGLLSALQELAVNAETFFGISCQLKCDPAVSVPADDISIHLYRIAQEAIDNAVRHGKSKHVWLRLWDQNGIGIMSVTDDGSGITAQPRDNPGMGLRIMKYRAEMIGGILQIRKAHNRGTIVECSFHRRAGREGKVDGESDSTAFHRVTKKIHSVSR